MSASFLLGGPLPSEVQVVEVGPRDGLQNEPMIASVDARATLIEDLADAGLRCIEVGSFVSPKWVPQMAGTAEVLQRLKRRAGVSYPVLVPNRKGLEAALSAGAKEVAVFAAASETFSQRNTNASIVESLRRIEEVTKTALDAGVRVRGYVSCALGCPYEGTVPLDAVVGVATGLFASGCYEVSLGDTMGAGTPLQTQALVHSVGKYVPLNQLAMHFHDTWGQALANVLAALAVGITVMDASVGGLGGCPYAPGAAGNVATEDLVYMLHGMGIQTGVDLAKLSKASATICQMLGRKPHRGGSINETISGGVHGED